MDKPSLTVSRWSGYIPSLGKPQCLRLPGAKKVSEGAAALNIDWSCSYLLLTVVRKSRNGQTLQLSAESRGRSRTQLRRRVRR